MAKLKLTNETIQKIQEYIAAGLTKKGAAEAVEITERSFWLWMKKGEDDANNGKDTIYQHFFQSVKRGETEHKLSRLKIIQTSAATGNWTAAAWELERRYPEEYGKNRIDVEVSGKNGGAIQTESTVKIYLPDNERGKGTKGE